LDRTADINIHQAAGFLKAGKTADALACLRAMDASCETSPVRCNLAGMVCLAAGENHLALAWFDRALALAAGNPDILSNRGAALQELGRRDEALRAYEQAVGGGCAKASLYHNRGNLLRDAGRLAEAIASYKQALELDPAYPEAFRAAGLALRDLGQLHRALEFVDEALRLQPGFVEALADRGNILQELARPAEALASYNDALELAPGRADILNNRGAALLSLGRLREADADFTEAIRIAPLLSQAWSNRGNLFLKLQQPEAALAAFNKALELRPNYVEALCGRAVALKYQNRFAEALAGFDAALACDPASPHARNNKGALLLLLGEFEEGLELYESRWVLPGTAKEMLKLPVPEWNGENPARRSILVLDEQGYGDAIQFARYLPLLAERGASVTFFCRKRLHRLFKGLPRPIRIIDCLNAGDSFDYQIALLSLPRAFKTRLSSIPAQLTYLRAETPLVQKWMARIGSHGFKVGICWRGKPDIKADPARSIPLGCFARLAGMDGVRLISIQKPEACADREALPGLIEPGEDFDAGPDAFADTAALMQNLDLIITCDTSIAHLAGALGRPVWVLLRQVPDWRWLLDREDSPWYPAMRLFRQRQRGDWDEVLDRVMQALQAFRDQRGGRKPDELPGGGLAANDV
jgi:tetratricopeptide (TPR) repeat protein